MTRNHVWHIYMCLEADTLDKTTMSGWNTDGQFMLMVTNKRSCHWYIYVLENVSLAHHCMSLFLSCAELSPVCLVLGCTVYAWYHAASYCLHQGMKWLFMLCYIMLCYIKLCYIKLCYTLLCYTMMSCNMLCYIKLCYTILCYTMMSYNMF